MVAHDAALEMVTMKTLNIISIALLNSAILALPTTVRSAEPPDGTKNEAQVLSQLDLARPELAKVKAAMDSGAVDKAFNCYKSVVANRVATLPPVENCEYWLFGSAKAEELLNGVLTTGHYGLGGSTTYSIGKPGAVDWLKMPDDGYDVAIRDIATMQWSNKLAEGYGQTGDKRYLDAYLGYWSDFAEHWYPCFQERMRDPKFSRLINGSISWAADSRLYNAWRLRNITDGLNIVFRRVLADNALGSIDNTRLASILKHLFFWETPRSMRFLIEGGGLPNQQQQLASGMFTLGVMLPDIKEAESWRHASLDNILNRSGYLNDGTDMEQSFNYNKGLHGLLDTFIRQASAFPAAQTGWVSYLAEMTHYRYNFMHSIVMPMTGQPICGNNNTWSEYDKPVKVMPGITDGAKIKDFSKFPLSDVIRDRFYGEKKMPAPGFRSIYFPYGGYYALRSDWSPEALYSFMKVSRPAPGHMREENLAVTFSAFGRQLLVNSGANSYSPTTKISDYGQSSISQNSIAVDGYGQALTLEVEPPAAYTSPLGYRFLDGNFFSFAEGVYDRRYSGWNFLEPKLKNKAIIRDVRHARQVILLRNEKLWIVTDVIKSQQEHLFTQIWNFPPEFAKDAVIANDGVITTCRPNSVNVALHQFADGPLGYEKYYGLNESGRTLGWVALADKTTGLDMTPKVDLHCSWHGKGEKILITVVVPFKGINPVKTIAALNQADSHGVAITLAAGSQIEYRCNGGKDGATLKTNAATLTLLPGGGSEKSVAGTSIPVIVAKDFRWRITANGEIPEYTVNR